MKKLYLDACCLNRPFDDQRQDRIRLEAEAVIVILRRIEIGEWEAIGSEVLDFEIEQAPDPERRERVKRLARLARESVRVDKAVGKRAQQLQNIGFRPFDALHVACAEASGADAFLTTDDQLLRCASRGAERLRIRVENPLAWLKEVLSG